MDFFDAVSARRSVRKYSPTPVPEDVMQRALSAALLAPNSSNLQTWGFYWVRDREKKERLIEACLSQSAAKTAQELLVVVAEPLRWKKHNAEMISRLKTAGAPPFMFPYYQKLIPWVYGFQVLAPLKWLLLMGVGFFRPMMRHPWNSRDRAEVAIKSAALACENFMLAISAQGFATCPMEGFDEFRVKRLLGLGFRDRVVMVISVGEADPRGFWGERIRFPEEWFIHKV